MMIETRAHGDATYLAPISPFLMAFPIAKLALPVVVAALAAACSPAPMPISQSSRDPSNPSAAEGISPTLTAAIVATSPTSAKAGGDALADHELHLARSEAGPSHDGHEHVRGSKDVDAGASGVVYVCPMHPDVTSSGPALCPKCNMKLVPKK